MKLFFLFFIRWRFVFQSKILGNFTVSKFFVFLFWSFLHRFVAVRIGLLLTAISRKDAGKNVNATIPKGNMGYDQYTVPDDCSCRTYFGCFPLALKNTLPWPFLPILSNFFEEQRTQNHPQCLSGLSRALFPTTFVEIALYISCILPADWGIPQLSPQRGRGRGKGAGGGGRGRGRAYLFETCFDEGGELNWEVGLFNLGL